MGKSIILFYFYKYIKKFIYKWIVKKKSLKYITSPITGTRLNKNPAPNLIKIDRNIYSYLNFIP